MMSSAAKELMGYRQISRKHANKNPHASAGFALYAWAFIPSLWHKRWQIAAMVTVIAWLMGGYKMLIGDHFFSHTLVSMSLAWGICAAVAWAWCRFYAKGVSAKNS